MYHIKNKQTISAYIAEPDSLADLTFKDEDDTCYEGFQYVKNDVEEIRFGELSPCEVEWDEDSLDEIYPRLSGKYCEMNDEVGSEPSKPWWKFW